MRIIFLGLLLSVFAFMIAVVLVLESRVDDLEEQMTTFETVRIEVVAPAEDSG